MISRRIECRTCHSTKFHKCMPFSLFVLIGCRRTMPRRNRTRTMPSGRTHDTRCSDTPAYLNIVDDGIIACCVYLSSSTSSGLRSELTSQDQDGLVDERPDRWEHVHVDFDEANGNDRCRRTTLVLMIGCALRRSINSYRLKSSVSIRHV